MIIDSQKSEIKASTTKKVDFKEIKETSLNVNE
jgi:hypothetical protein